MQKNILSLLTFLLIFANFQPTQAQKKRERCGAKISTNPARFEQWMRAKKAQMRSTNEVYKIPVVVHIIHESGLKEGEKENLSTATIDRLMQQLNDDFRRRLGTLGYNDHPAGADARIEFHLARQAPDGAPTNGIVRIDESTINLDNAGEYTTMQEDMARYSYWNPEHYLNIWFYPMPDILLGSAEFPETDLPGVPTHEYEVKADGVFINSTLFQAGAKNHFNLGRTLTHEIGHFLGLLHIWGNDEGGCHKDDFCDDTPPVATSHQSGCSSIPTACDGSPAMIANYMDYSYDQCMNIFTQEQVARMRTVLAHSPRRQGLLSSPVLTRTPVTQLKLYPNPVAQYLSIVPSTPAEGKPIKVCFYDAQGRLLGKHQGLASSSMRLKVPTAARGILIVKIETAETSTVKKFLVGN